MLPKPSSNTGLIRPLDGLQQLKIWQMEFCRISEELAKVQAENALLREELAWKRAIKIDFT